MLTSTEIRRERLEMLIKHHGSIASLNVAIGWPRTDPKLAQIRNANPRPGRAKPYQMGDSMAREIEEKLGLDRGWMDTPPEFELGSSNTGRQLLDLFGRIPDADRATALRLLDALAKPHASTPQSNGTTG